MFAYLWNSFVSGILFFVYLIADSWWWIFGIIIFILLSVVEGLEINEMYIDDEREIF